MDTSDAAEGDLQRFVASSPWALAMLDAQMRYLVASDRWLADYGLEGASLDGRSYYEVFPAVPESWKAAHRRCLEGSLEECDGEEFVREDGRRQWLRWQARPWYTREGAVGGIVIHSEDITALKLSEGARRASHAALAQQSRELRGKADQLRRLASDLTLAEQRARRQLARALHDQFQQILFGATLKIDRLAKRLAAGPASDLELLERARNDVEEAVVVARSLAVELCPPALQERTLPAALVWLADWMNQKYGLLVEIHADPRATSDRDDLRVLLFEAVRELLFNIVKHAHVDAARLDVTLDDGDRLGIRISDHGVGFDPASLPGTQEGTAPGWGLFSIRERLALLGGRFAIDSAPGRGTTFTLSVPLADDNGRDVLDPLRESVPAPAEAAVIRAPLRILIADDHGVVRDSLRELFGEHPEFEVVGEAADGREAVAQAQALRPDAVVMDVSMPHMDGVEATRRIRASLPTVAVFGLSTQEQTESLHAIEQAGAAGYFTKGDDAQRLVDRLLAVHAQRATTPAE